MEHNQNTTEHDLREKAIRAKLAFVSRQVEFLRVANDELHQDILKYEVFARDMLERHNKDTGILASQASSENIVRNSLLFDQGFYLKTNPDVKAAELDPVFHYIRYGCFEGRDPCESFSESSYRLRYPDVARSDMSAVEHFERFGCNEQRKLLHSNSERNVFSDRDRIRKLNIARTLFEQQQSEASLDTSVAIIRQLPLKPLVSIIMPIYNTPLRWLEQAIESLQAQYYGHWQLCAVDDCSPTNEQRNFLRRITALDSRISFKALPKNVGIAAASNEALRMAEGEYVALLDHDDELTHDALLRMIEAINENPDADFLYSDECKMDDTPLGEVFCYIFKPDWSPEMLFNNMLTGHLTLYKRSLFDKIGLFRGEFDYSQDYDFALRAAEVANCIVHVERILYLWRANPESLAGGGKSFARSGNVAALQCALNRRRILAEAIPLPHCNQVRLDSLPAKTPASIVIPSDSEQNLKLVLNSIKSGTTHSDYEIVVVCNSDLADTLKVIYEEFTEIIFCKYDRPYNFSDKCNAGAQTASNDVLIFYNDDVFPLQNDWIARLIEYLDIPGVGGVSPKLLHRDNSIQYAGMISGTPGICGTAYNNLNPESSDDFLSMHNYVRNVTILSGACCALKRDTFFRIGGFDSVNTPDGHSDLDLSYKLIERGYRCLYTPHSLLRHIGNHSWLAKDTKYKADIFCLKRWGKYLSRDPHFTKSMKTVLYLDFAFDYDIYAQTVDASAQYKGADVLFVTHELTLTGAPRMLLYAARAIKKSGGFPVIVAPEDGPLRQEIQEAGLVVIVDSSIRDGHFLFERFARNFDLVVVNTIVLETVVHALSKLPDLPLIWWLHEAQPLQQIEFHKIEQEFVHIVCVSEYAKSYIPQNIGVSVIHNGVFDSANLVASSRGRATTFLLSGTIEPRKGLDIFVTAIETLPVSIRQECRFLVCGKLSGPNRPFFDALEDRLNSLPEICYLGFLSHHDQLKVMCESDVIVCCSRDEAFSLTVAEAAMLGKPAIISETVGIAEVLDQEAALRFESGDAISLSNQIAFAANNLEVLKRMGCVARSKFDTYLTIDAFERRFRNLVLDQTKVNL